MTATLNKVSLIGHISAEPKSITTKGGNLFATVSLATNESLKRNGEWESVVEWHQLIFFGSMVKITEHLRKGSQVYIEGRIRSNNWTDNAGNTQRSTSIVVTNVQLLGHAKAKEEATKEPVSMSAETQLAQMREILETSSEETPF
ncbi:single-stranded DNA-binding protein [Legionella sp. CNM-4043-24]|uniref:single-stranded DNA-binding protein n=1 Tax=Legionella sp. CNM-4043-24 TaxID=3421646 RepID=UPI00403B1899